MKENILTVSSLAVSYKDKQILKDVTFSLQDGEIMGLVGESGSGKSTLAKAVLGLIPYKGEIIHTTKRPQMIFQDPYGSLNPVKKAGWILEEPLRLMGGFTETERKKRVLEMLKLVGLDEKYLDRYPNQLSGGQRQRICIATALMQEPKLLIADEPVSALDVTIQAQILELLKKIHDEMGLSILFISHDLRVVYHMCSQVMIMQHGQIVEKGDVEKVYFHHENAYTGKLLKAAGIAEN